MTRAMALTLALAFMAALLIGDRVIAGVVQCDAAQTCPYSTILKGNR